MKAHPGNVHDCPNSAAFSEPTRFSRDPMPALRLGKIEVAFGQRQELSRHVNLSSGVLVFCTWKTAAFRLSS
jgi:hypothetical protein